MKKFEFQRSDKTTVAGFQLLWDTQGVLKGKNTKTRKHENTNTLVCYSGYAGEEAITGSPSICP